MRKSALRPILLALLALLFASSELGCSKKSPDGREILIQSEEVTSNVERPPAPGGTTGPIAQMNDLIARKRIDTHAPGWRTNLPRPPTIRFPKDRTLYWMIETNFGLMKIELFPREAPKHVSTTMYLTQLGFYDGLTFHRIIPKFMVQGGDPKGDGTGGPGFTYGLEVAKRPKKHDERGRVSAANAGPNSDGSQFFILFGERAEHLDGKHTVFGQLVQGQGTLTSIETAGTESGTPRTRVFIEHAWITEVLD